LRVESPSKEKFSGGEGEDGAETFAAGPERVAHGLVDAGGTGFDAGVGGDEPVEGGFDLGDEVV